MVKTIFQVDVDDQGNVTTTTDLKGSELTIFLDQVVRGLKDDTYKPQVSDITGRFFNEEQS